MADELRLDDPAWVRSQYADESALEVRQSVYAAGEDGSPFDVVLAALAEVSPRRVLEVGGGQGAFAARLQRELDCAVVGADVSERMVELQRSRGLTAQVGDVQQLPFADGEFDAAVANYMLYHVADLDRALAQLARVLRPGGRLVAATNAVAHLQELWALVGRDRRSEGTFNDENGAAWLRQHFARVERRDAGGWTTFPDEESVRRYIGSSGRWTEQLSRLPAFETPLRARVASAVFVADTGPHHA